MVKHKPPDKLEDPPPETKGKSRSTKEGSITVVKRSLQSVLKCNDDIKQSSRDINKTHKQIKKFNKDIFKLNQNIDQFNKGINKKSIRITEAEVKKKINECTKKISNIKEKIVECNNKISTFNKIIKDNEKTKHLFTTALDNYVLTVSRAYNKVSHVFNLYIIHRIKHSLHLNDCFKQSFISSIFNLGIGEPEHVGLLSFWNAFFSDFPVGENVNIDCQCFSFLATKYLTNFTNSLWMNFKTRQATYISTFCKNNGVPEKLIKKLIEIVSSRIKGDSTESLPKSPYSSILDEFIKMNRHHLRLEADEKINDTWLKNDGNYHKILRYYYVILEYLEQFEDAPRFNLAPIASIKRHHIPIDGRILFHILKNSNLLGAFNIKVNGREKFIQNKEHWFQIFSKRKIAHTGARNFDYRIDTDGVSISMNYRTSKKEQLSKNDDKGNKKEQRIIGLDPGRVNLIYAVEVLETEDGKKDKQNDKDKKKNESQKNPKLKTYKINSSEYYCSSGINKRNKKAASWNQQISKLGKIYQKFSCKTTSFIDYTRFLRNYYGVYDELWEEKTGKKWARQKFRAYIQRNSFFDRKFQEIKDFDKNKEIIIAYGAAKFKSTGKKERPVPTVYVKERCKQHFKVVEINEYNTTKCCHTCGSVMDDVSYKEKVDKIENKKPIGKSKNKKIINKNVNVLNPSSGNFCPSYFWIHFKFPSPLGPKKPIPPTTKNTQAGNKHKKVDEAEYQVRSVRGLKWCGSTKCFNYRNRDINAALNIRKCYIEECKTKKRPEYLTRSLKGKPKRVHLMSTSGRRSSNP